MVRISNYGGNVSWSYRLGCVRNEERQEKGRRGQETITIRQTNKRDAGIPDVGRWIPSIVLLHETPMSLQLGLDIHDIPHGVMGRGTQRRPIFPNNTIF